MAPLFLSSARTPNARPASLAPPPEAPLLGELGHRLERPAGYDDVFGVVREVVHRVLGRERPGLGLALSNLPPQLGAYWPVTGNLIVLNEGLVAAMRASARSPLELNSFVYVILAHEYLHSLGYLDEASVRRVTARVTRAAFGPEHLATRMAEGDLWRMYPFLADAPPGDGRRLRIVPGFDRAATATYIR
jgi:hypothetical protein